MTARPHLLVVDDDDRIRGLLKRYLARAGFRVTVAADAESARRMLAGLDFDLAIFDIMMPGEDGLSLLKGLRARRDLPVILLTARGLPEDRIEGLKHGADDYLPKPFEPEELELRIAAILRRAPAELPQVATPPEKVVLSGRRFWPERAALGEGAARVRLTEAEVQLLRLLAEHPGEPVSRERLARTTSTGLERSVDVQVTRLRRKIEPDPKHPTHLQTVRGVGYRLVVD